MRIASHKRIAACAALALLALAPAVLGAEEGHSPGLFTGNIGNIIWTLITFIAVVFALGRFAWNPLLRVFQSREEFIRQSLKDAEQANKKAAEQLAEYTEQLATAKAEASAIIDEGRRDAEKVKRSIHEETRKEADAMIARAKREIGMARDAAVKELYDTSATLATNAASKIIAKELDPADHRRLIEESIAELNRVKPGRN